MIHSISLNAYSYNSQLTAGSSKLSVPVNPSAVIYSQFDHISGVAARQGQNGVSVSKIRILNTLIEQLVTMRSDKTVAKIPQPSSGKEIDALIRNYQNEIRALVRQAKQNPYILPGASPMSGALFSIEAV